MQLKAVMTRSFIDVLNQEMRNLKLEQTDLAKSIGVSESTVSRWLNVKHPTTPDLDQLMKLSTVIQVSFETLAKYVYPEIDIFGSNLSADAQYLGERFDKLPESIQDAIRILMRQGFD